MSRLQLARTTRPGSVSRALARDRLGVPAVLFFVLAGVAPLTVAAGVIPTAYQTTGLTAIPAAFLAVAVILAVFSVGYVAMTRHITNSGAFYAFISRGISRPAGVAAALVALVAYTCLQVGLYGALGPAASAEAATHLGVHASWWAWALAAWAVVTVLGQLRVDITGWVLGVLLTAEITVTAAETICGLATPAGGQLSFATLSPAGLARGGFGAFGVLAVVSVLGFVGFEQAPVGRRPAAPGRYKELRQWRAVLRVVCKEAERCHRLGDGSRPRGRVHLWIRRPAPEDSHADLSRTALDGRTQRDLAGLAIDAAKPIRRRSDMVSAGHRMAPQQDSTLCTRLLSVCPCTLSTCGNTIFSASWAVCGPGAAWFVC